MLGTKRTNKCAKKISPTPLHYQYQPEPLVQGKMDPGFHIVCTKFWPQHLNVASDQAKLFQFSIDIAFLQTSVVTSYCCLIAVRTNLSILLWPLRRQFSTTELLLTGYMLFFWTFFVNPGEWENPSRSAVSEMLRPARLAPTAIPHSKSLKSPSPFWSYSENWKMLPLEEVF